jgi:hypothetical protein
MLIENRKSHVIEFFYLVNNGGKIQKSIRSNILDILCFEYEIVVHNRNLITSNLIHFNTNIYLHSGTTF